MTLAVLRAAGFTLRAAASKLVVSPVDLLTDEWRAAIREHKAGLLALLAEEAADPFAHVLPWGPGPWGWLPRPGPELDALTVPAAEARAAFAAWEAWNRDTARAAAERAALLAAKATAKARARERRQAATSATSAMAAASGVRLFRPPPEESAGGG